MLDDLPGAVDMVAGWKFVERLPDSLRQLVINYSDLDVLVRAYLFFRKIFCEFAKSGNHPFSQNIFYFRIFAKYFVKTRCCAKISNKVSSEGTFSGKSVIFSQNS